MQLKMGRPISSSSFFQIAQARLFFTNSISVQPTTTPNYLGHIISHQKFHDTKQEIQFKSLTSRLDQMILEVPSHLVFHDLMIL